MAKHGKKYREVASKVDKTRKYELEEAVKLLKEVRYAKFDESVDVDVRLNIDPRNAEQQVRGTVVLPHGTGKTMRVAAFAEGEKAEEAKAAGADVVGSEDLMKKIQEGWTDFDAAVATPDMMKFVGRIGKILGPRGLMPNPKAGTVTMNIGAAVKDLKGGKVEFRHESKQPIVHCSIGKVGFTEEQLVENIRALLDALQRARPAAAKGQFMRSVSVSTTMGPGIALNYGAPTAAAA